MTEFWYPLFAWVHWFALAALLVGVAAWGGLFWLEGRWADMSWQLRVMRGQASFGVAVIGMGAVLSTLWLVTLYGRWW
jgi:hypothetical protein